jgi:hypothetical protein
VLDTGFAHPGYGETLVNFGVALLGLGIGRARTGPSGAPAASISLADARLEQRA